MRRSGVRLLYPAPAVSRRPSHATARPAFDSSDLSALGAVVQRVSGCMRIAVVGARRRPWTPARRPCSRPSGAMTTRRRRAQPGQGAGGQGRQAGQGRAREARGGQDEAERPSPGSEQAGASKARDRGARRSTTRPGRRSSRSTRPGSGGLSSYGRRRGKKNGSGGGSAARSSPLQGRRPILINDRLPGIFSLFLGIGGGSCCAGTGQRNAPGTGQKKWAAKGEETRCPEFPNRGRRPTSNYVAASGKL